MKLTTVYDQNLNKVAILENAYNIGYSKKFNKLWTAQFSLPSTDEKNSECLPFRYVEFFDGDDRVELFRIVPSKIVKNDSEKSVTYHCEHVLATLLDDVMFQYHERIGLTTENVLSYILNQQSVNRWQLGNIDFVHYFHYKWENENLLSAVFSVPKPFDKEYMWTFDTNTFPWTLNLVALSDVVNSEIRYRKNMKGIVREDDPTQLCTKLYALGYGEGVNQLGISNVNNGLPYIEADTINDYGVIAKVFVDRRYEDEEILFNVAKVMLDKLKRPKVTYTVEGADIYQISNDTIDKFELGTACRTIDEDFGIFTSRIVQLSKSDVKGSPGEIKIEIANITETIASSIANLSDRARVNEVYAQGATNLDTYNFADNCDPTNPAIIRFYIPEETARINKMILSYKVEAFRAYSKATKSGGGSTETTEGGGGIVTTTSSGGGATNWFNAEGGVDYATTLADFKSFIVSDGDPSHFHLLYDFYLTTPNHEHDLTLENHTHDVIIPDHTHDIDYGIYLRDTLPTSVTIKVDGNIVTGEEQTNIDIVPYLNKDASGKIQRGTWHEIKITPDDLGRIVADVASQIFVQSRGGGDY